MSDNKSIELTKEQLEKAANCEKEAFATNCLLAGKTEEETKELYKLASKLNEIHSNTIKTWKEGILADAKK